MLFVVVYDSGMKRSGSHIRESKPAIGYCRVSTTEQAEFGLSLAAQAQKIRTYCKLSGLKLADVWTDDGYSAAKIDGRPQAEKLVAAIEKREVGAIVFLKLDRLFRNLQDAIRVAELCRKRGVTLHSITEKIDTSSAMGDFFFNVMASIGQLERKQIGERTAAALRYKRSIGEKTGGAVPFGYSVRNGSRQGSHVKLLVEHGREQQLLAWIRRARKSGKSLRAIGMSLQRRGMKTKSGRSTWSVSALWKLLRR